MSFNASCRTMVNMLGLQAISSAFNDHWMSHYCILVLDAIQNCFKYRLVAIGICLPWTYLNYKSVLTIIMYRIETV